MAGFKQKLTAIILVIMVAVALGGCAGEPGGPAYGTGNQPGQDKAAQEKAVIDGFHELMQNKAVDAPDIYKYIDANIAGVPPASASIMLMALEKVQKERLTGLQDKYADSEAIQQALAKRYSAGPTDAAINSIENQEARALVQQTLADGYKIETAEGMYFPIIDYSVYRKYRNAVTPDMAAYIDIMAVESDKVPAKDAALVISWAEVLQRAAAQERFLLHYGTSAKAEDVRQLLQRYASFALYGANNTPLFGYDTQSMVPAAKKVYLEAVFASANGSFSKAMNGYMTVLKESDYKLTAEVQQYRKRAAAEIY